MAKFLTGNFIHAQNTLDLLNKMATMFDQAQKSGKILKIKDIVDNPDFALLAKGDYKILLDMPVIDGVQAPNVFDGQKSYVDFIKSVEHQQLIVTGLQHNV